MSRVRIVLAHAALAPYPEGGGLWMGYLQYLLGLEDLGHDVFWLEVLRSSGNATRDERFIKAFFDRMSQYGFGDRCALLLFAQGVSTLSLELAREYGKSKSELKHIATSADLLWNFASSLRQPLLSLFKRRVLVDGDPGHLQVSALSWDVGLNDHHVFLTAGTNLQASDCDVPTLGLNWRPFRQFVYLPLWEAAPDPGPGAPFTSITQWNWGELHFENKVLSIAKRDGYLRYVSLPQCTSRLFELAANVHSHDNTGDRDLLLKNGWGLADPHIVAGSPTLFQEYIKRSRAEISCPKPIYRGLKTGWFSERSACYLASGRPVLAEDTGISEILPAGRGLLTFQDMNEAVEKVSQIDSDYELHSRSARRLAEEFLGSRRCLSEMLDHCR
jgi:hypothetical protein